MHPSISSLIIFQQQHNHKCIISYLWYRLRQKIGVGERTWCTTCTIQLQKSRLHSTHKNKSIGALSCALSIITTSSSLLEQTVACLWITKRWHSLKPEFKSCKSQTHLCSLVSLSTSCSPSQFHADEHVVLLSLCGSLGLGKSAI